MMTKMRKMRNALVAAAVLVLLAGCARNREDAALKPDPGQSDLQYVQSKGTLVVGITDFAPMDYRDGEEWTGFDAQLAQAFAETLGVTLEFREIDWDQKTKYLEDGRIDCIWNGMTMTQELEEAISCSEPYLSNAQVVVLRKGEKGQFRAIEDCQHLLFAVEAGSTGETLLSGLKYRYTSYPTQMEALQSVSEKKADGTVIDIIMASYHIGDDREFPDLEFDISLNDEKICVGFRKDSDLTQEANAFLERSFEDGTIYSLADQYGIRSAVLEREEER